VGDRGAAPAVTVVLSTRNPGARIADTVRSILSSTHPDFVLCVVDQTEGRGAGALLGDAHHDPRLHHLRSPRVGLAIGRNLGVEWAASDVVAFTDDDCVVTSGWLDEITAPFAVDERIAVVLGTVRPAPYDPALGFLPSYRRAEPFLARGLRDKHRVEGMGASMAIRRSAWRTLHGFDEMLGAGAPLRSAEETDFVLRALAAGFYVYETPAAVVVHSGFRAWAAGRRVIHDYLFGIGAALAKNLRCGHAGVVAVLWHLAVRWTISRPVVDLGIRSHRRARLAGFLSGVRAGLTAPLDRRTGLFRRPADADANAEESSRAFADVTVLDAMIADRSPARLEPSTGRALDERVSIIVPSWNARPFLERALRSLVAKTRFPYELVVVDNGSTDGSKDFLHGFLAEHREVDAKLIENPQNLYFSTACNQGFRAASPDSKYFALYCNDVEATSERWLDDLVAAVEPEDVIAAGHVGREPITDRQRGVFRSYEPEYPDPEVKRRIEALLAEPGATYPHLYGYCFLLKREPLERTGLYLHTGPFTQYHSDWELCLRFLAMGWRIAPVAIGVHHWHSVSELLAFHPELYRDLLRRIEDPATLEHDLRHGRPFYEEESGFRALHPTRMSRAIERIRRRVRRA
jgi:GT2 family glycosyltransferase